MVNQDDSGSKLKSHALVPSETERVRSPATTPLIPSLLSCPLLVSSLLVPPSLLMVAMLMMMSMTMSTWSSSSLEEASFHQVLNIDASSWEPESPWESKPTWKTCSSSLLELLLLRALIPSHVIHPPPLWVLQQLIGINHLFKLLLSPRILLIAVRMVLLGSLLEACLDLLLSGVLRNAQHLVRIGDPPLYERQEGDEDEEDENEDFPHITCEVTKYYNQSMQECQFTIGKKERRDISQNMLGATCPCMNQFYQSYSHIHRYPSLPPCGLLLARPLLGCRLLPTLSLPLLATPLPLLPLSAPQLLPSLPHLPQCPYQCRHAFNLVQGCSLQVIIHIVPQKIRTVLRDAEQPPPLPALPLVGCQEKSHQGIQGTFLFLDEVGTFFGPFQTVFHLQRGRDPSSAISACPISQEGHQVGVMVIIGVVLACKDAVHLQHALETEPDLLIRPTSIEDVRWFGSFLHLGVRNTFGTVYGPQAKARIVPIVKLIEPMGEFHLDPFLSHAPIELPSDILPRVHTESALRKVYSSTHSKSAMVSICPHSPLDASNTTYSYSFGDEDGKGRGDLLHPAKHARQQFLNPSSSSFLARTRVKAPRGSEQEWHMQDEEGASRSS